MINLDITTIESSDIYPITNAGDFEKSYFNIELEISSDLNDKYTSISSDFYKSLKENSDSTSIFDTAGTYYDMINRILKKYIVTMNDHIFNQFTAALSNKINDDRQSLQKYYKALASYSGKDIPVTMIRYNYSYLDSKDIPNSDVFSKYLSDTAELDKLLRTDSTSVQYACMIEFNKIREYILSDKCYNSARGRILGKDKSIPAYSYNEAIFNTFRSGGKMIQSGVITPKDVQFALKRFKDYDRILTIVNKQKKIIVDKYDLMSKNINKYDLFKYKGVDAVKLQKEYQVYKKIKTDQLLQYCNLYQRAYVGKLDAITNAYMQDREILLRACAYINVNYKEEDFEV